MFDGMMQAVKQTADAVQAATGAAAANITAGAQNIAAGAHTISAAASGGKLSVDPQTGEAMTKAINTMLAEVTTMQGQLIVLGERPQLGNSPDAVQMAGHSSEVATGGSSVQEALKGLHQALVDLKNGIKTSMDNYSHTDAGGAANLNQIHH